MRVRIVRSHRNYLNQSLQLSLQVMLDGSSGFASCLLYNFFSVCILSAETVRSALDVVSMCCVSPRVQLLLTEKIDMRDADLTTGVHIVLGEDSRLV